MWWNLSINVYVFKSMHVLIYFWDFFFAWEISAKIVINLTLRKIKMYVLFNILEFLFNNNIIFFFLDSMEINDGEEMDGDEDAISLLNLLNIEERDKKTNKRTLEHNNDAPAPKSRRKNNSQANNSDYESESEEEDDSEGA